MAITGDDKNNHLTYDFFYGDVPQVIDGREGNDTLDYTNRTDAVLVVDISDGGGGRNIGTGTTINSIERLLFQSYFNTRECTLIGGGFDDYLFGSQNSIHDFLSGGAGDDRLLSLGVSGVLNGGPGNDLLTAKGATSALKGGIGDDLLTISIGHQGLVDGGAGIDKLRLDCYPSTINLDIDLSTGASVVDIGNGTILRNMESVHILAAWGEDTVVGGAFDDYISGGESNDSISGGAGNDQLLGERRHANNLTNDILDGGSGNDTLLGGGGDDILRAGTGDDFIHGNAGEDIISCGAGNDDATGDAGEDRLYGGRGNDTISEAGPAAVAPDTLFGGAGDDVLEGGNGADVLVGGIGSDTFVYASGSDWRLRDSINGFSQAEGDRIDLSRLPVVSGELHLVPDNAGMGIFSKIAGEVRFSQFSKYIVLQVDFDGDGDANLNVVLRGVRVLVESDFVF